MNQEQLKEFQEFEKSVDAAKLRALGKISLERPLTDLEFTEMMKFKDKLDELI